MWCVNFLAFIWCLLWILPNPSSGENRDFLLQLSAQTCPLDAGIITTMKTLGILKKRKKGRGGLSKISALFYNVDGREKFERSSDPADLGNHSFTFLAETWLMEHKSSPLLSNKDFFVVHADKNAPRSSFWWLRNVCL